MTSHKYPLGLILLSYFFSANLVYAQPNKLVNNQPFFFPKPEENQLFKTEVNRSFYRLLPTLNIWLVILLLLPVTGSLGVWLFVGKLTQKKGQITQDINSKKKATIQEIKGLLRETDFVLEEVQQQLDIAKDNLANYQNFKQFDNRDFLHKFITVQYQGEELVSQIKLSQIQVLSSLNLQAADLETLEELGLGFDNYIQQGNKLLIQGLYQQSMTVYDQAIKVNNNSSLAWFNWGFAAAKLQRYAEAMAAFERAIACQPNYIEAWLERGQILEKLVRYQEALNSYKKATTINPDCVDAWIGYYRNLMKLDREEEAVNCWEKISKIQDDYYI
jgi:tetratricopeptide (TPR) repeat protein